jgi:endonuclease/exonuclease/phosphatase family metal-dependent hydrolase
MADPGAVAGGVRVATLNLWGLGGDWPARRAVIADGLRALRPDLVAFQEAVRSGDCDQTVDLLGPDYQVVQSATRERDGRGISVASRWPLGEVREVDLKVTPRTADFACTTLVAEVLAPEPLGPLLVVNHLPSFERPFEHERELQAVAAARVVEELVGGRRVHVVVAGDFDATPDTASVRFWCGLQSLGGLSVCYRDAWESTHPGDPGHTLAPGNPLVAEDEPEPALELGRRIDYILVRCRDHGPTLDVAACERLFDQPVNGVWASDHFGVTADLAVPGARSDVT